MTAVLTVPSTTKFDSIVNSTTATSLPDCFALNSITEPILFLPPLLSRLPSGNLVTNSNLPFDHSSPTVGFTTNVLPSIDCASRQLHKALHNFRPTSRDYYYSNYADAFNWNELILEEEIEKDWYIVAFRSVRAVGSTSVDLYKADRAAHEEAVESGGLIMYWYGLPSKGNNLATCIWTSRESALQALKGEAHANAMKLAAKMYASYQLERYTLRKKRGSIRVEVLEWIG